MGYARMQNKTKQRKPIIRKTIKYIDSLPNVLEGTTKHIDILGSDLEIYKVNTNVDDKLVVNYLTPINWNSDAKSPVLLKLDSELLSKINKRDKQISILDTITSFGPFGITNALLTEPDLEQMNEKQHAELINLRTFVQVLQDLANDKSYITSHVDFDKYYHQSGSNDVDRIKNELHLTKNYLIHKDILVDLVAMLKSINHKCNAIIATLERYSSTNRLSSLTDMLLGFDGYLKENSLNYSDLLTKLPILSVYNIGGSDLLKAHIGKDELKYPTVLLSLEQSASMLKYSVLSSYKTVNKLTEGNPLK